MSCHAAIEPRAGISSPADRFRAAGEPPRAIPGGLDLCREQLPATMDRDAARFIAEARKSPARQTFRPAFSPADWRTFASFCIARRLAPGFRVLVPGDTDRALRFVVEGRLRRQAPASMHAGGARPETLLPGAIVGEDALFADGPGELDVRTLDDSLVLELSRPRQAELTASHLGIAFEMLRAAGAVIAGRLECHRDSCGASKATHDLSRNAA